MDFSLELEKKSKFIEEEIKKLNHLEAKEKTKRLEAKLEKTVNKLGFAVELARLKLFKPCELDELIRDMYKKKVLDDVTTKNKTKTKAKSKTTKTKKNKSQKKKA